MPSSPDHISMALFCDFENVALGVRDAKYEKFDIKRVLERLLLKGSIVVKKAYCDWDRYKGFKAVMHEANFELIEIPHVRQSGKNSADIRLVVDALDLCYTKSHVNTFVIISGDSDFSPLVSKLRENAKHVIGVGVKQSTSDLLIANCDEFIFYDDLVRESQRAAARRDSRDNPQQQAPRRSPEEDKRRREEMDARRAKIIDLAVETYEALVTDRDDGGRIWASVLKEALKRRNPGFSESYYGFKTFGNLLEEAQARGLLEFGRDEKSGAYVYRGSGVAQNQNQSQNRRDASAADMQHGAHPSGAHRDEAMALSDAISGTMDEPARREDEGREAQQADERGEFAPEAAARTQDQGRRRGTRGGRRGGRDHGGDRQDDSRFAQPEPAEATGQAARSGWGGRAERAEPADAPSGFARMDEAAEVASAALQDASPEPTPDIPTDAAEPAKGRRGGRGSRGRRADPASAAAQDLRAAPEAASSEPAAAAPEAPPAEPAAPAAKKAARPRGARKTAAKKTRAAE